ncbi:MAG TPA: hypothetical protein VHH90_06150 [Polyangia bacterium]|nr:hypothetical protein [Polyangia bacterium]
MVGPSKLVLALALAVAAPLPLTDEAVHSEVDRLVAAIASARHLTYHGTLPVRVLDRAEAARQAERLDDQTAADPAATTEAELLRRLGLASPGRDPEDSYDERAAAPRFDAVTGRLWVPGWLPLDAQQVALTHAVAHAVADQRFGFRRLMDIASDGRSRLSGDARRARLAVVEGDAMLTGLEVLDPRETFLAAPQLNALAARLRAAGQDPAAGWPATLSTFTHVTGLLFVARARAHRPWNTVDALWTDPPSSTEQVLHPEKYESCEAAVTVDPSVLPALPGLGRPSATDVAGELVVRAWLATAWGPEVAARSAAGWGGDRAALYEPPLESGGGGGTDGGAPPAALAWLTIWDDAAEADDFARAARAVLERQVEKGVTEPATEATRPDGVVFSSAKGLYGLARRADAVALLIAAPEGAEPALQAMLDAVRRVEPTRKAASRPRPAALPGCLRRDRAGGSE